MALETGSVVNDLVTTNPTASDAKSQGDDHLRLIKSALKNSFPGFTGAVLAGGASTGVANAYVLSATLPSYTANTVVVFTPNVANTGATTININSLGLVYIKRVDGTDLQLNDLLVGQYAVMAYTGTEFRLLGATKGYIDNLAFNVALPAQTGNAGKLITTDGTTASWTNTPTLSSINGGQLAGLRNRIINGNFGINQRAVTGTVTLAAGAYGHDRWKAGASGCTYTFATALNVTTLTISAGSLIQVIEGNNLESGTYTLSWTGTATGKIGAGALSASGITGTAVGGTNLNIEFSTGTLSKIMYEIGSVATPFEQRPYGMELALCQRYCQSFDSTNGTMAVGSSGFYGDTANITFSTLCYGSKMRTYQPTVTTTGTQVTDFGVSTSAGVYQAGFTFTSSNYGAMMSAQKTAHGLTPSNCFIGIQSANGRITLSSEL